MGLALSNQLKSEPFTVTQTLTANWPGSGASKRATELLERYRGRIREEGGVVALPASDIGLSDYDAVILSEDNEFRSWP